MTPAEAKELSKEFEALDTGSVREGSEAFEAQAREPAPVSPTAASADEDITSFAFPQQPSTEPSAPPDEAPDFVDEESDFDPSSLVPAPRTDPTHLDSTADELDSVATEIAPTSHQTSELPLPHAHLPSEPPAFPSAVFPSAPPSLPSPPTVPSHPAATFSPGHVPAPAAAAPRPAPPPVVAQRPDTFDPMTVGDIQKHARWAISALNYEDFETARKELRLALAILGE